VAISKEDVLTSTDLVLDGLVIHDDTGVGSDLFGSEKSLNIFRVFGKLVLAVGKEKGDCS